MALYDYKIGANYDLPDGSLTNIEDITPPGDEPFPAPQQYGNFRRGQRRVPLDGPDYVRGFQTDAWVWGFLTRAQEKYLRDTYCNGGYSGKVTYTTMSDDEDVYTRHNTIIRLPDHPEANADFTKFLNYRATFTRVSGTL